MNLVGWIILGFIAGWVAKSITGVGEKRGCLFNIVIGIIGALVGGFVFDALGERGVTGLNVWSLFVAAVGAILFLWLAGMFRKR